MGLQYDIVLDENAFSTASKEMADLEKRTKELKKKLKKMYQDLTTALDTPAGKQVEMTAEKVLIEPIDNLMVVVQHISKTLTEIKGTGCYKDVFIKFEQLNQNIKFN